MILGICMEMVENVKTFVLDFYIYQARIGGRSDQNHQASDFLFVKSLRKPQTLSTIKDNVHTRHFKGFTTLSTPLIIHDVT